MTEQWESLRQRLKPRPEGRCLLGLSGGADSVALLRMLLPMRDAGEIDLEAVHVNHGMRGKEADEDETFVSNLCRDTKAQLHRIRVDLSGKQDENTARVMRYRAFESVLQNSAIPTLILAHQREDQAETFLLHLLRGAGPDGLRAMRNREPRKGYAILRPMLDISGKELRQALEADNFSWREDGSNQEIRYLRNRIRLELLPQMEEMAPGVTVHLARSAELIGRDGEAMDQSAERLLLDYGGSGWILTKPLEEEPEAIRSRVLRLWWNRNGPRLDERTLSYAQTKRLESLLNAAPGTTVNLPAGWRARKRKDRLILLKEQKEQPTKSQTAESSGKENPLQIKERP